MKQDEYSQALLNKIPTMNWEELQLATNELFKIGGNDNINSLLMCLENPNPLIRNAVALTFMDNKFHRAVSYLFKAINKPENNKSRGTLIYSLQSLNCEKYLPELFYILFNSFKNLEVQLGILDILDEQEFIFRKKDLIEIKDEWSKLKPKWNELNGINEHNSSKSNIDSLVINDFVEYFIST